MMSGVVPKKAWLAAVVTAVFFMATSFASPGVDLEAASPLPAGASSLEETYKDWRLHCVGEEDAVGCLLTQRQVQRSSGQLLLAVEFAAEGEGGVAGAFLLPFGLALGSGVTLQIDDGEPGRSLPFATCLPAGCIVGFDADAELIAALRAGETLHLLTRSVDGQGIRFGVSLNGFGAGLDRLIALAADG